MDQSTAPILDALVAYRERGDINFTPPGHKPGRGIDDPVAAVLGRDMFAADVMTQNGSTTGCSTRADLMVDLGQLCEL